MPSKHAADIIEIQRSYVSEGKQPSAGERVQIEDADDETKLNQYIYAIVGKKPQWTFEKVVEADAEEDESESEPEADEPPPPVKDVKKKTQEKVDEKPKKEKEDKPKKEKQTKEKKEDEKPEKEDVSNNTSEKSDNTEIAESKPTKEKKPRKSRTTKTEVDNPFLQQLMELKNNILEEQSMKAIKLLDSMIEAAKSHPVGKRTRKPKDPNNPDKPKARTEYSQFISDSLIRYKTDFPELTSPQRMAKAVDEWQKMKGTGKYAIKA